MRRPARVASRTPRRLVKNPLACAPPIPHPVCMLRALGSEFYGAWQRGKKGGPGGWRYAHCMASCRSRRDCNIAPAVVSGAGQAWEWTQVYGCLASGDPATCHSARADQDRKDNEKGYSCPVGRDCTEQCHDLEGRDKGPDMWGPWQNWGR